MRCEGGTSSVAERKNGSSGFIRLHQCTGDLVETFAGNTSDNTLQIVEILLRANNVDAIFHAASSEELRPAKSVEGRAPFRTPPHRGNQASVCRHPGSGWTGSLDNAR